jgi:hypothetical protein
LAIDSEIRMIASSCLCLFLSVIVKPGQLFPHSMVKRMNCGDWPDRDRNRGPLVVVPFNLLDLFPQRNKVRAEFLSRLGRESGGTATEIKWMQSSLTISITRVLYRTSQIPIDVSYVRAYVINRFIFCRSISPVCCASTGRFMCKSITCRAIVYTRYACLVNETWRGIVEVIRTLSRSSSCSSLTMKIISNLDKIVVWKSIFWKHGG